MLFVWFGLQKNPRRIVYYSGQCSMVINGTSGAEVPGLEPSLVLLPSLFDHGQVAQLQVTSSLPYITMGK